jgi:hypothetical protein
MRHENIPLIHEKTADKKMMRLLRARTVLPVLPFLPVAVMAEEKPLSIRAALEIAMRGLLCYN